MKLKMPELSHYVNKYTDEEIRGAFLSYISESDLLENRERLVFRVVVLKEKNLSRTFVEKGVALLFEKETEEQKNYIHWHTLEMAMGNHELNDSFFEQFIDVID